MILVDSSVWINYFSHYTSPVSSSLENLIRSSNQAVITGIVYQEVLQGIRNLKAYELTSMLMRKLIFLPTDPDIHEYAAQLFRKLLLKGVTPATVDILIAALAIKRDIPLFTLDSDFKRIAEWTNLRLYK